MKIGDRWLHDSTKTDHLGDPWAIPSLGKKLQFGPCVFFTERKPVDTERICMTEIAAKKWWQRYESDVARLILAGSSQSDAEKSVRSKWLSVPAVPRKDGWAIVLGRTLAAFLRENCVVPELGKGRRASAAALYGRFKAWFAKRNPDCQSAPSSTAFGAAIALLGFKRVLINGRTFYQDVALTAERT